MKTIDGRVLWVVGAGGLLGRALVAEAALAGSVVRRSTVPWHDPAAAAVTLARDARTVLSSYRDVSLFWCAGPGVVATQPEALNQELKLFTNFLEALAEIHQEHLASVLRLYLASSAGGVYAGSDGAPFTETTQPCAISPYGEQKIAAEAAVRAFAARTGFSALIGRMSNLYGPGQDLAKPQGLITQLCRAQLQRAPLLIYVSLDTARDYLYVRDAARMVLAGMVRLAERPHGTVVVKIFASRVSTTLAAIVGEIRRVTKRRSPIVMGASPSAQFQVRDLRFRSVNWTDLDSFASTPLPAGIACTLESVAASIFASRLGR
jgi:UDP-glucose 4-epimerase